MNRTVDANITEIQLLDHFNNNSYQQADQRDEQLRTQQHNHQLRQQQQQQSHSIFYQHEYSCPNNVNTENVNEIIKKIYSLKIESDKQTLPQIILTDFSTNPITPTPTPIYLLSNQVADGVSPTIQTLPSATITISSIKSIPTTATITTASKSIEGTLTQEQ